MRMEVAQDEAEGRELVDDLDGIPDQILVVDDARRAPPPPEPTRPAAGRRTLSEILYVKPLNKRQGQQPAVIGGVKQPFEVTEEADAQRAQQAPSDAGAGVCERCTSLLHQHLHDAECADHDQRVPERDAHIEPDRRVHPAQPDE